MEGAHADMMQYHRRNKSASSKSRGETYLDGVFRVLHRIERHNQGMEMNHRSLPVYDKHAMEVTDIPATLLVRLF
jgi:hypothetical protein